MRCGVAHDVRFLGNRPDVHNIMKAFHVFVLSSLHKGVPMVLLEVMAPEVPIVASNVGGIPEILEHGREAVLIPAKDPGAISTAIGEVAGSSKLRTDLIRAARIRVETQFSIQLSAARMRDMYRSFPSAGEC